MIKVLSCITGQHSIPLVLMAAVVCAFGSLTALSLLARARDEKTAAIDWRWLVASSAVAGAAVWSTHFLAMLAYEPALPLGYDVGLTALSIAIAMLVTLAGFSIALYAKAPGAGGAVFGAAIGAMHFTGMAALTAPATFGWDPVYVVASLVIGMAVGALAFRVFMRGSGGAWLLSGTALMCLAIAGLHFTAMSALSLTPDPVAALPLDWTMPPEWLAVSIAVVMAMVIILGLVATITDHLLASRAVQEAERLRAYVADLEATKRELETTPRT